MTKSIDARTANSWLQSDEAIIIDVREPGEHALIHIPGSTLIPVGAIENGKLPSLDGRKLIIHCMMGKRGGAACEKLLSGNPDLEVYNLEGGILAWQDAGFKVVKAN